MNFYKAIQLHALACILDDDFDDNYQVRQVMRWYSCKFNTPLHEVYGLSIPFILQHYYECAYEEEKPQDLEKIRELLIETGEEKAIRLKKEEKERLEDEEFAKLAEEEEKVKPKQRDLNKTLQNAAKQLSDSIESLGKIDLSLFPELKKKELPQSELPKLDNNVFKKFELELDNDELIELDGLFKK